MSAHKTTKSSKPNRNKGFLPACNCPIAASIKNVWKWLRMVLHTIQNVGLFARLIDNHFLDKLVHILCLPLCVFGLFRNDDRDHFIGAMQYCTRVTSKECASCALFMALNLHCSMVYLQQLSVSLLHSHARSPSNPACVCVEENHKCLLVVS